MTAIIADAPPRHRVLGLPAGPMAWRRWQNFKANRRAWWSLWIFIGLVVISLFAELLANDRPILVVMDGRIFLPALFDYPETAFGGQFPTRADFNDPYLRALIAQSGWMLEPLVPFRYDTLIVGLEQPVPAPPSAINWLGTDDQARDVVARVIYGFRISVLFGLILTAASSVVGVAIGLVQGYFGGWVDLIGQRLIEIWSGLPTLFILILLASIVVPSFWVLLVFLLLFSWTALTGLVRAEVLRARNFEYVRAARALGVSDGRIMWRHVLPNAMVASITMLPFITAGALTALTSLDFLGYGLPPGSPSLGELVQQGRGNLFAPWLAFTGFVTITVMLTLLVFIGEGVRDAFDPRKSLR
jgi:microcin C transport system permease protein